MFSRVPAYAARGGIVLTVGFPLGATEPPQDGLLDGLFTQDSLTAGFLRRGSRFGRIVAVGEIDVERGFDTADTEVVVGGQGFVETDRCSGDEHVTRSTPYPGG